MFSVWYDPESNEITLWERAGKYWGIFRYSFARDAEVWQWPNTSPDDLGFIYLGGFQ